MPNEQYDLTDSEADGEEEEDGEEAPKKKATGGGLRAKYQKTMELGQLIQNKLGMIASFGERFKKCVDYRCRFAWCSDVEMPIRQHRLSLLPFGAITIAVSRPLLPYHVYFCRGCNTMAGPYLA